jgi:hypothetical protein
MVAHTIILSLLGLSQDDQDLKLGDSLGYLASSRPAWAT